MFRVLFRVRDMEMVTSGGRVARGVAQFFVGVHRLGNFCGRVVSWVNLKGGHVRHGDRTRDGPGHHRPVLETLTQRTKTRGPSAAAETTRGQTIEMASEEQVHGS